MDYLVEFADIHHGAGTSTAGNITRDAITTTINNLDLSDTNVLSALQGSGIDVSMVQKVQMGMFSQQDMQALVLQLGNANLSNADARAQLSNAGLLNTAQSIQNNMNTNQEMMNALQHGQVNTAVLENMGLTSEQAGQVAQNADLAANLSYLAMTGNLTVGNLGSKFAMVDLSTRLMAAPQSGLNLDGLNLSQVDISTLNALMSVSAINALIQQPTGSDIVRNAGQALFQAITANAPISDVRVRLRQVIEGSIFSYLATAHDKTGLESLIAQFEAIGEGHLAVGFVRHLMPGNLSHNQIQQILSSTGQKLAASAGQTRFITFDQEGNAMINESALGNLMAAAVLQVAGLEVLNNKDLLMKVL